MAEVPVDRHAISREKDRIMGALIGLARAVKKNKDKVTDETDRIVIYALGMILTENGRAALHEYTERLQKEKERIGGNVSYEDYDMKEIWEGNPAIRAIKSLIFQGLSSMAIYLKRAAECGFWDKKVNAFFYKVLYILGQDYDMEEMVPTMVEQDNMFKECRKLLDKASLKMYDEEHGLK